MSAILRGGHRGRHASLLAAVLALGVVVAGTTACSDDGPPPLPEAGAFAAGVCRDLAPDLIETLRLTQSVPGAADGIATLARDLVPSQEKLYNQIGAAGEYAGDLERVTTAVGFLRLRVDAGTYEPALLTEVMTSTRQLVERCT
ncbi:hypothetical protein [Parafrankia sp. EUN1f]|uniref:hypothetical protein n=1 Tax=Parafrankia sp. EUN1f TaxID=102897 RepID=UPI0001C466DD|nr:hypothetical protein [Parafrankia sp. EUN1f]EFC86392.1 hypothetical protein FrEUN1fDRAFT_0493 [Parafrankia sp. EUN1f]